MGSNSSKIEQQQRKELKDSLRALDNKITEQIRSVATDQDQILRSQSDLQRQIRGIGNQNSQLKEEISCIRDVQNESMNQSRIQETKMEEEMLSQLSVIQGQIITEQDNKLFDRFNSLQDKLAQVDKRLTDMNSIFSAKCDTLEQSVLTQLKQSQELSQSQTSKMIEEVVSTQLQKIQDSHAKQIEKVENDLTNQQTRLQNIEVSVKQLNDISGSTSKTISNNIDTIYKRLTDFEAKISENQDNQIITTKKEVKQLRKEMTELKATILQLEKVVTSSQSTISQLQSQQKQKESQIEIEEPQKKPQLPITKKNQNQQSNGQIPKIPISEIKGDVTPKGSQQSLSEIKEGVTPKIPKQQVSEVKDVITPKLNIKKSDSQTANQKISDPNVTDKVKKQDKIEVLKQNKKPISESDSSDGDEDSNESENYPLKKKIISKAQQLLGPKTPQNSEKSLEENVQPKKNFLKQLETSYQQLKGKATKNENQPQSQPQQIINQQKQSTPRNQEETTPSNNNNNNKNNNEVKKAKKNFKTQSS